jgi:hypothetical protein
MEQMTGSIGLFLALTVDVRQSMSPLVTTKELRRFPQFSASHHRRFSDVFRRSRTGTLVRKGPILASNTGSGKALRQAAMQHANHRIRKY